MKILLISSSSGSRGGGELYLLYLGRALAARGHRVSLWMSSHPRMDELAGHFAPIGSVLRSEYRNTYDRRGRSLASHFDYGTARRLAAEWRAGGFDQLHLNKQNLEDGLDLLRAARWSGVPSLAMIHITQSARYLRGRLPALRDWVARRGLRHFGGPLVTVPESRRRDLADFLGDGARVRIVPTGVPLPDLSRRTAARAAKRAEIGLTDSDLVVLGVGRMAPQKRPLEFLAEAGRIHRAVPAARFVWVGDGVLTGEWDHRVAELGLAKVVQRLPWQTQVEPWLLMADVLLHTAEFEGLSIAILEALAAGLPCSIPPHLLREMPFMNAENSIAIEPAGDAWMAPLHDKERLTKIGAAARRLAEAEFSFDRMAASYEALYTG